MRLENSMFKKTWAQNKNKSKTTAHKWTDSVRRQHYLKHGISTWMSTEGLIILSWESMMRTLACDGALIQKAYNSPHQLQYEDYFVSKIFVHLGCQKFQKITQYVQTLCQTVQNQSQMVGSVAIILALCMCFRRKQTAWTFWEWTTSGWLQETYRSLHSSVRQIVSKLYKLLVFQCLWYTYTCMLENHLRDWSDTNNALLWWVILNNLWWTCVDMLWWVSANNLWLHLYTPVHETTYRSTPIPWHLMG